MNIGGKIIGKGGSLGDRGTTPSGSRWSLGRGSGDKVQKLETFYVYNFAANFA